MFARLKLAWIVLTTRFYTHTLTYRILRERDDARAAVDLLTAAILRGESGVEKLAARLVLDNRAGGLSDIVTRAKAVARS